MVASEDLPDTIAGRIRRRRDGGFTLFVNRSHSAARRRLTLAHQIGHIVYHRDLIGAEVEDDLRYLSPDPKAYGPGRLTKVDEHLATTFALNLLMPQSLIDDLEGRGLQPADIARELQVPAGVLSRRIARDRAADRSHGAKRP